jgi:hypothetical protein
VGAFFCQAIKEELEADVAILNGAPIKGDATYPSNKMSYAELRKELPFPTKMVVVKMSRGELEEAIAYSRKYNEKGSPVQDEDLPRRGYLQMDWDYALDIEFSHEYDKLLQVALPRNLLKGFCQIKPLMAVGERLKRDDCFPGEDDYIPALNLVVRYCSKHRWADVLQEDLDFGDLDLNSDGVLDHNEVKTMLTRATGREPPDFIVDEMISAVDHDNNGVIDVGEFSYLLATAERDQRW